MEYIIFLIAASVLLLLWSYVHLFWKRFVLKRKLVRFCKKEGGELAWHRSPFGSVFSGQKGFDFSVRVKGKRYRVALLSARKRHREYSFISPDELLIHRKLKLLGVAGGRVRSRINEINFGFTSTPVPIDLNGEDEEGWEKILLFYPVSRDVTCIRGTKKHFVGNGDPLLNGYRFFTLTGLLREMESVGQERRKRMPWEDA